VSCTHIGGASSPASAAASRGAIRSHRPPELRAIYSAEDYFQLSSDKGIGYRDYFADAPVYRPYFRRKFATLRRFARPPGALLELGAGAGFALDAARDAGWDVRGLELSPGRGVVGA
jgi:hypothetical protein